MSNSKETKNLQAIEDSMLDDVAGGVNLIMDPDKVKTEIALDSTSDNPEDYDLDSGEMTIKGTFRKIEGEETEFVVTKAKLRPRLKERKNASN